MLVQYVSRRQPVRSLRASEHSLLCMPRTRRHWDATAFSVAAPSLWNALPQHLTLNAITTAAFKTKLKTNIFSRTFFVQRCDQQMSEHRYISVTIKITNEKFFYQLVM